MPVTFASRQSLFSRERPYVLRRWCYNIEIYCQLLDSKADRRMPPHLSGERARLSCHPAPTTTQLGFLHHGLALGSMARGFGSATNTRYAPRNDSHHPTTPNRPIEYQNHTVSLLISRSVEGRIRRKKVYVLVQQKKRRRSNREQHAVPCFLSRKNKTCAHETINIVEASSPPDLGKVWSIWPKWDEKLGGGYEDQKNNGTPSGDALNMLHPLSFTHKPRS